MLLLIENYKYLVPLLKMMVQFCEHVLECVSVCACSQRWILCHLKTIEFSITSYNVLHLLCFLS
jgi:hypothetical protein